MLLRPSSRLNLTVCQHQRAIPHRCSPSSLHIRICTQTRSPLLPLLHSTPIVIAYLSQAYSTLISTMAVTLIDPFVSWAVVILLYIIAAFYAPLLFWSHVAAIAYLVIYHDKTIPRGIKFEELLLHDTATFQETSLEEVIHSDTATSQETSLEEAIHSDTATPQDTSLDQENELTMERQAEDLLDIVKDNNVLSELKIKQITELKAHIKHRHVPDAAISPSFEIIRVGIMSLPLQDAAFSTLNHLTKRLVLQEQQHIVAVQGAKTYPLLVERLGDHKDRVRTRASQALTDFWLAASADVEEVVRDAVLSGKHPRAKEAGLQWILKASSLHGLKLPALTTGR